MNTPEYIDPKTNPVCVILGATGGIGSEVCRRLAARGARLVVRRVVSGFLSAVQWRLDGHDVGIVHQPLADGYSLNRRSE